MELEAVDQRNKNTKIYKICVTKPRQITNSINAYHTYYKEAIMKIKESVIRLIQARQTVWCMQTAVSLKIQTFFLSFGATARSGSGPPHSRGF